MNTGMMVPVQNVAARRVKLGLRVFSDITLNLSRAIHESRRFGVS